MFYTHVPRELQTYFLLFESVLTEQCYSNCNQVFTIIQVIVSIAVAAMNSKSHGGYKSATFTSIWAMLLALIFCGVGGQIVFKGNSSPLLVGFMIGVAAMLCQLFFVLMCVFFVLGTEATHNGYGETR